MDRVTQNHKKNMMNLKSFKLDQIQAREDRMKSISDLDLSAYNAGLENIGVTQPQRVYTS